MKLFGGTDKLEALLERLVKLYELELRSKGLSLEEGTEEGEFSYTDETLIERLERDENVRRAAGLPASTYPHPVRPDGREWGADDLEPTSPGQSRVFGAFSGSFGSGPEGAASTPQDPDPFWYLGGGPPPRVEGYGGEEKPEGKSGPDSAEAAERSTEEPGSPAGEKA